VLVSSFAVLVAIMPAASEASDPSLPLIVRGAGVVEEAGTPHGTFKFHVVTDGVTATGAIVFAVPVSYQGQDAFVTARSTDPRLAYVTCEGRKPASTVFSGDGTFVLRSLDRTVLMRGTAYIKASADRGHTGALSGYVAPTEAGVLPIFFPDNSGSTFVFIGNVRIVNGTCLS
jgi:hypothetical protein